MIIHYEYWITHYIAQEFSEFNIFISQRSRIVLKTQILATKMEQVVVCSQMLNVL